MQNGVQSRSSLHPRITHPQAPSPVGADRNAASSPGIPNIIVFGETGAGKSSLINMLAGSPVARTSSGAVGETFSSKMYDVNIKGRNCYLWDTAGMNEGNQGTVPDHKALENLRDLVFNLQDGVHLLLYCIRGGRYGDILRVNYDLFYGIVCRSNVPIVVVITGLEQESPMESWWEVNKEEFVKYDLRFEGHACVTTTRGKVMKDGFHAFEEEYMASEKVVEALILKACLNVGVNLTNPEWLGQIDRRMVWYMTEFNRRSGNERHALEKNFLGSRKQDFRAHATSMHGLGNLRQDLPANYLVQADIDTPDRLLRLLRSVTDYSRCLVQELYRLLRLGRPTHDELSITQSPEFDGVDSAPDATGKVYHSQMLV